LISPGLDRELTLGGSLTLDGGDTITANTSPLAEAASG
jgi:hypothetical protein